MIEICFREKYILVIPSYILITFFYIGMAQLHNFKNKIIVRTLTYLMKPHMA